MNKKDSLFKIGQNSLEVFQAIVLDNKEISYIRVISHNVCINWRQINPNERAKVDNLKKGLKHYLPNADKWYPKEDFLGLRLEKLETISVNEVWSVNSRVRLDDDPFGDFKHVPMMNFHFENGIGIDDAIKAINIMPCVLVSPRYIGHALNDGYCSLRLTADSTFKPKIPTVVHIFN